MLNPLAGGADKISEIGEKICLFIKTCEWVSSVSAIGFGAEYVKTDTIVKPEGSTYLEKLISAITLVSDFHPDVYLLAGGDGFAAYAADCLLKMGIEEPKLLGVAMGTANIGPIIAFSADDLMDLPPDNLLFSDCGAIEAFDGLNTLRKEDSIAFGFNDIVIGNTLLGTIDNKTRLLSARAMAKDGSKIPIKPMANIGENLCIEKNGLRKIVSLPKTAQIIVSALEREHLIGRAVSGLLCFHSDIRARAALICCSRTLVTNVFDSAGFPDLVDFSQLVFGEDDIVSIDGLKEEALLIADGNPYEINRNVVTLKYRPDVVKIAQSCTK
ncbi:MAG: hypothetical protein LBQ95_02460 [Lachnospiraceae bacterium]|nr:hypothetical protein [Lachnospiraceae bacterium]